MQRNSYLCTIFGILCREKKETKYFKKNENKHNLTIWQHNNKMEVHCTTH